LDHILKNRTLEELEGVVISCVSGNLIDLADLIEENADRGIDH